MEPAIEPSFLRVLVDAGLDHLVIEVVALAGALADAGEHRIAAVRLGDVVDQFHDQHGLADAGAAEQADLAALGVRREQIDDLDAGDENLGFGRLLGVGRRVLVDRAAWLGLDRAGLVDRIADDVDDAAERLVADRNRDRRAGVGDFLTAHETFGDVHRDGAHGVFAEMLGDFEHQAVAAVRGLQRVQDRRQVSSNCTSTTAPMTWVIVRSEWPFFYCLLIAPSLLPWRHGRSRLHDHGLAFWISGRRVALLAASRLTSVPASAPLQRFGAGDDLDQFLRDHRLTRAVVSDGLLADHFAGVAGRVVHRASSARRRTRRCFPAARGTPAPRCCAAEVRRGYRPLPARIRRRRRGAASAAASNTGGMICSAVGICAITDLKREKNSVQTSNVALLVQLDDLFARSLRHCSKPSVRDAAQLDTLDDLLFEIAAELLVALAADAEES